MTDKPRRSWFQLHLSTAIVMMFVAGGLLGLNIVSKTTNYTATDYAPYNALSFDGPPPEIVSYSFDRGWPFTCERMIYFADSVKGVRTEGILAFAHSLDGDVLSNHYVCISMNVVACCAILMFIGVLFEFLVHRRREARAP